MYMEKRPTCVTVIGWAWIILGGFMCLSATMALFSSIMIGEMAQEDPAVPTFVKIFPIIAMFQICVAILGLVSGLSFLKLKAWARPVLESITWLLLVFMIGFGIFWLAAWVSLTSASNAPQGFGAMGAIMGVVIVGIYAVPLGIMIKYLRGQTVKNAMVNANQQQAGQMSYDPPPGMPPNTNAE